MARKMCGPAPRITSAPASTMARANALSTLDASGAPFVAFVDAERGGLHVAYRRYDGHYGLLAPAGAP